MIRNFTAGSQNVVHCIGVLFAFALVYLVLRNYRSILPRDKGREFAVNGALSAGKPRGAGLIFVPSFILAALMFDRVSPEKLIYMVLLAVEMATGYLDDSSATPWGELKKGLLDFAVAAAASITYVIFNGSTITMPIFNLEVSMHPVIYVILAVILIWTSINVTNCTDGVDGLSGTLTIITLFSFFILDQGVEGMDYQIVLFIASLLGYQWFNAKPSLLLMGDAGSRAMGFFIAIVAMKSGHPFMFIPLALIMILDGGLGLVKVSFIRYLKLKNFMANVKTPLHDNVRKRRGWSDTQTVFRFAIMQIVISIMALYLAQ